MFKRILALLICFNIGVTPALCIIEDEFAQKTLINGAKVKKVLEPRIVDDFAESTPDKNIKVETREIRPIQDIFAEKNRNKNNYIKPTVDFSELEIVIKNENRVKKKVVDIGDNSIPVKIQIKKHFSTKHKVDEGDFVEFKTLADVKIKNKTYQAGTIVQGRIETISQNKIWGVPSDLVIGNFTINGEPLKGEINKTGANRSLWLYPTIYITTMMFGVGLLLIPLRGGHAKIKPTQVYTVHYHD